MSPHVFADDPIDNKDEDQLQRLAFADQVAELCVQVGEQSETSVMALVGPWGSGKSSILALASTQLATTRADWDVVEFNPWLFSDIESLILSFFGTIGAALPATKFQAARSKLGKYVEAVAPYGKAGSLAGVDLSAPLRAAATSLQGGSADNRRKQLEKELRELGRKILVVVDDIDRLHPSELLLVLKLIRLVGRLPNIYYLLAYDERTILDVLTQSDLARGKDDRAQSYLEKIVQVRLDLPPLHEDQQGHLIDEGIEQILRQFSITLSESDGRRIGSIYHKSLKFYLNQPRSINRYLAQVNALYPLVHGEVDFVDFLLITFLRTFEPTVYLLVQERRAELVGLDFSLPSNKEPLTERKARWLGFLEKRVATDERKQYILELLGQLFVPIQSAIENMNYGSHQYEELGRKRQVGSSDYFDRYFQFGVPSSDISDAVVHRAVEQLAAGSGYELDILRGKLETNPGLVLRKIAGLVETSAIDSTALILFLSQHYDTVAAQSRHLFFGSPDIALVGLARRALIHLPGNEVEALFDSLIANECLAFASNLAAKAHSDEQEDYPGIAEAKRKLRSAFSVYFQILGAKPVRDLTDQDTKLIYRWTWLEEPAVVGAQLWQNVTSGWSLVELLGKLVPEATSFGATGAHPIISEMDVQGLDRILGVDRIIVELGDRIDQADDDMSRYEELDPTQERREQYALAVLKNIKLRRAVAEPDAQPSEGGA